MVDYIKSLPQTDEKTLPGHGFTIKLAIGYRL